MAHGLPYSNSRGNAASVPDVRRVSYPVRNLTISTTAGVAAVGFGTAVLGDFPEGNILFLGAISYLQFLTADADIIATWSGNYSVGTVATVDNDVADTGEADVIASAAIGAATAKLSPVTRGEKSTVAMFDNTDGSLELNLNLLIADASFTDGQSADFTANGYVQLCYIVMGDD